MNGLIRFGESLFPHLWDTTWKATALMMLVFALNRVLGKRRVAARYWLCVYCLVGVLVLPLTSFLAKGHGLALLPAKARPGVSQPAPGSLEPLPRAVDSPVFTKAEEITSSATVPPTTVLLEKPRAEVPTASEEQSDPATEVSPVASPTLLPAPLVQETVKARSPFPWKGWAGVAWLTGFTVSLLRLLFAGIAICRIRASSSPVSDSALTDLFEKAKSAAGMTGRVRLSAAKTVASPVSLGMFRPSVLLPETLPRGLPSEQLYPILLHELAHIRSGDCAVNTLERIVRSLLFFHPLIWLMSREMHSLREEVCDDKVLDHYADNVLYAKVLTDLAGGGARSGSGLLATLCFFNRRAMIERRVERILSTKTPRSVALRFTTALTLLIISLVLVGSLSLVAFTPRALGEKEAAEKEAEHGAPLESAGLTVKLITQPKQVTDVPEYIGPARKVPVGEVRYAVRPEGFRDGELLYTDRTYTLVGVPQKYQGLTYIQTANNDKMIAQRFELAFEVNVPAIVYVAHDDRVETKPTWLQAFEDTGDDVASDDPEQPAFSLYAKPYPAGKVVVGPNCGFLMSSMYFAALDQLRAPYAKLITLASSDRIEGEVPLRVQFYGDVLPGDRAVKSYTWDFDDGSGESQQNPVHTYAAEGSYMASLIVTDTAGEVSSAKVGIRALPKAGFAEAPTAIIQGQGLDPGVVLINLDPYVNTPLKGWHGVPGNDIALEPGVRKLGDSTFRIGQGAVELAGTIYKGTRPDRVEGVRMGLVFQKLHILHATGWGAGREPYAVPNGTHIGSYTIHYEGETAVEIPIKYGVHVRDWWARQDDPSEVSQGKVVWTGEAEYPWQHEQATTRLYSMVWENPHPANPVTTIDFASTGTICAPFVVAMTAEGAAPAAEAGAPVQLVIDVTQEGKFVVGGVERPIEELGEIFQSGAGPDADVVVRCHPETPHETIVQILEACEKANITNVSFSVTRERKEENPGAASPATEEGEEASTPPATSPEALYVEGSRLRDEGRTDEALKAWKTLIEKFPESSRAGCSAVYMGQLQLSTKDFKGAEESFRLAAEKFGHQRYGNGVEVGGYGYFYLTQVYCETEQYENAAEALKSLVEKYPYSTGHRMGDALTSFRAKRWFYDKLKAQKIDLKFLDDLIAEQKDSKNFDKMNSRQLYLVAHTLMRDDKDNPAAIKAFLKGVEKFPEESFTPYGAVFALQLQLDEKDHEGAKQPARLMIEKYGSVKVGKGGPLEAIGYYGLGAAHFLAEEYEKAAEMFQKLSEQFPAAADMDGVQLKSLIAERYLPALREKGIQVKGFED